MKPTQKKLLLTKESLRGLTQDQLEDVGGAAQSVIVAYTVRGTCVTCRCPVTTSTLIKSIVIPSSSAPISY
jgi:hypothetical protein